ncbi:MAG: hypothetical protein ACJA0M_001385 [Chitinophagales bacterium]|jgi:hypothetical protein
MNSITRLFILNLFALFIIGCEHPIEIKGAGNVISASGKRDCLFKDRPCSNLVIKDYVETYSPEPRDGWKFSEWEGCYGTYQKNGNCSFNIAASIVRQFWGKTVPPIKATFLRPRINDTGMTFGGVYPEGLNSTCNGTYVSQQDCSSGRDVTDNNNADGRAGFIFTKRHKNGARMPASAEAWSCVTDNVTGLTWEVKTTDGGVQDLDKTYRWGGISADRFGSAFYSDWNVLVNHANKSKLCGFNDWRVPRRAELVGLIDYSLIDGYGRRDTGAVDTNYFPTISHWDYWTSSAQARDFDGTSNYSLSVQMSWGSSQSWPRTKEFRVVLARGE